MIAGQREEELTKGRMLMGGVNTFYHSFSWKICLYIFFNFFKKYLSISTYTFVKLGYLECVITKTCQHLVCESSAVLLKMNLWAWSILSNLLKRMFSFRKMWRWGKDAQKSINLCSYKYCQAISEGLLLAWLLLCQLANYNSNISLDSQRLDWVLDVEWWKKSILKTLPVLKIKWTPTCGFNILHCIAQSSSLCAVIWPFLFYFLGIFQWKKAWLLEKYSISLLLFEASCRLVFMCLPLYPWVPFKRIRWYYHSNDVN